MSAAAGAAVAAASGGKAAAAESNALHLRWCFGFNGSVANSVHSLCSPTRNALFYVSAHTGVLHDLTHSQQYLLQGHSNPITCVSVSRDKRWVATADFGPDAMLVVWDALTATPVKVIPMNEGGGVAAMDMSPDAMCIVTLSYDYPQTLAVWEWTTPAVTPTISAPVGPRDYQHCVRFNPVDVRDVVSNGAAEVIFWHWSPSSIAAFHPPRGVSKLKKSVRNLTQSTFIPYTTKAVTATTSGHLIAWDYPVSDVAAVSSSGAASHQAGRDATKILKLVKAGINLLDTVLDKFIVCGCADGAVRFFDFQFRVVAWFEDINAGMVTSISFAVDSAAGGAAGSTAAPSTQAGHVSMEEFAVPDFIVATAQGKVVQLDAKTMEHLTADKRRGRTLLQSFDDDVHALDAHPQRPLFAVGTAAGALQIWDVDERSMVASRKFKVGEGANANGGSTAAANDSSNLTATSSAGSGGKKSDALGASSRIGSMSGTSVIGAAATAPAAKDELANDSVQISCVKFGPKGSMLAVGFSNGFLKVVSTASVGGAAGSADFASSPSLSPLADVCNFHRSDPGCAITGLVFSPDGQWIASSDAGGCVALFRFWFKDDNPVEHARTPLEWIYVGKYRVHYRPIVNIFFEEAQQQGQGAKQQQQEEEDAAAASSHTVTTAPPPRSTGSAGRKNLAALTAATSAALAASTSSSRSSSTSSYPRLYSLGEDRVLQCFDLGASSIRGGLKLASSTKLEQTACPTAMCALPGRAAPSAGKAGQLNRMRDRIITANDEYKLKVWEMEEPAKDAAAAAAATVAKHGRGKGKPVGKGGKVPGSVGEDPTLSMSPSEAEEYNRALKCRKTLLAPLYGGSINRIFNLPQRDSSAASSSSSSFSSPTSSSKPSPSPASSSSSPSSFLVYSTFDKLVGLIRLPLDGNPTKHMACIAHPGEVAVVCASFDGKYLITAGGVDRAVNLWAVDTGALDAAIERGKGEREIDPYLSLIDGGCEGPFYQDLLDYFYYAQLRAQRLDSTAPRRITGEVGMGEAVNMMRALGFYPTEQQVVAMQAEVRYENKMKREQQEREKAAANGGKGAVAAASPNSAAPPSEDLLSLDDFLRLYLNHRPVFGIGARAFEAAFASLGARDDDGAGSAEGSLSLSSEQLVHQLMTVGEEPMSAAELAQCLDALLGERFVPEDAQQVDGRKDLSPALRAILSRLPARLPPHRFAQDILGFEDYAPPASQPQQGAAVGDASNGGAKGGTMQSRTHDSEEDWESREEEKQATRAHAIVISKAV